MCFEVYKRTLPNGKEYIGVTQLGVDARAGKGFSRYKGNSEFYDDIVFFGASNIKTEILYRAVDAEEAVRLETLCIFRYGTIVPYGYNQVIPRKVYVANDNGNNQMILEPLPVKRYAIVMQLHAEKPPAISKKLGVTSQSFRRWKETDDYRQVVEEMLDVLNNTLKIGNSEEYNVFGEKK